MAAEVEQGGVGLEEPPLEETEMAMMMVMMSAMVIEFPLLSETFMSKSRPTSTRTSSTHEVV